MMQPQRRAHRPSKDDMSDEERPTPERIREVIGELSALTDAQFAQALSENIMDQDAAETAAFRSPELVQRSYVASRALIDDVNAAIKRKADESGKAWEARAAFFRTRVGAERRLLEAILTGLRAQRGILAAAPNPRARAARDLQRAHPQEFLALVRQHQEAIKEENRAKKAAQKAARRSEPRRPR